MDMKFDRQYKKLMEEIRLDEAAMKKKSVFAARKKKIMAKRHNAFKRLAE